VTKDIHRKGAKDFLFIAETEFSTSKSLIVISPSVKMTAFKISLNTLRLCAFAVI
jgi:hypothetical protein